MAPKEKCKLSKTKIKKLLEFLSFIKGLNKNNRKIALKYASEDGLDFISESIFNTLYNSDCTSLLSKKKFKKLVKTLKPHAHMYKQLSQKNLPSAKKRTKIIQSGTGLPLLLSAIIPFLSSLLLTKK